ncbi:MAG TPA: 2OG-Fe(II) oxygenase [Croceibacterium sp.]
MTSAPPDLTGDPDQDLLRRVGRKVRRRLAANSAVKRVAADKAELWAVPRFFDTLECGRLMAMIDAVAKPSEAYDRDYSSGYRTSYSGNMDPHDPFVAGLQKRIDDLLGFDHAYGETVQGQRYLQGQQFRPHFDWFTPGTAIWQTEQPRGGQRAFTAMAYLNAVEEGGATAFPQLGMAVPPRPGTLLIWNNADEDGVPNPMTLHAGAPVTRGAKYIVTKWYRCRRWL